MASEKAIKTVQTQSKDVGAKSLYDASLKAAEKDGAEKAETSGVNYFYGTTQSFGTTFGYFA